MERDRIYGIGEPVAMCALDKGEDPMHAAALMEKVGFTAVREWMHLPILLENPTTVKPNAVALYTELLNRYRALDMEITGMSHEWYLAGEPIKPNQNAMYARDLAPGSLYMQTLEMLEQSWFTMVSRFPQVQQWEVGNEWNTDTFLHPIGWQFGQPGFEEAEKFDISVDMMYFAAKGIRRANPDAKVVSFSPAVAIPGLGSTSPLFAPPGYGIALALSHVYERIKSGRFWSSNTDDYFDMLAWHPYLLTQMTPRAISETYPAERRFFREEDIDAQWRSVNDMAYNIMAMNGDGHKKVLLTEMGFSDLGDPQREKKQAHMLEKMFEIVKTMPYIKTIHIFRLFTNSAMAEQTDPGQIGGIEDVYFGIFQEADQNFAPREKAYTMQRLCGGTGQFDA